MRIVFFGLPLAAVFLEQEGHDLVLCALSGHDVLGARRLVRRIGRQRVVTKPEASSEGFRDRVESVRPDLIVSWFWTKRIAKPILELAPRGGIGVHPSLLPRHRGPDPYFWAIESGDTDTGVTAHVLAEEYDTGAILEQVRVAIDPSWNAWNLARALDRPSLSLLCRTVRAFADGKPPRGRDQDEDLATLAPDPSEDLLELRWGLPAVQIARRVRAAAPWPGAFTRVADSIVTLTSVCATTSYPRALEPGEAAVRGDGVAVVRAGDEAVELLAGRDEHERFLNTSELAQVIRSAEERLP